MSGAAMCSPMASLARAREYCRRWGVTVIAVSNSWRLKNITHEGPHSGGINWPLRAIVFPVQSEPDRLHGSALLHELSHVLAGENPDEVDEVRSPMLALDFYGHRLLRLPSWHDWMDNYVAHEYTCLSSDWSDRPSLTVRSAYWWDIEHRQRRDLLAESLRLAVQAGLLDERGLPTFSRDAWEPRN